MFIGFFSILWYLKNILILNIFIEITEIGRVYVLVFYFEKRYFDNAISELLSWI